MVSAAPPLPGRPVVVRTSVPAGASFCGAVTQRIQLGVESHPGGHSPVALTTESAIRWVEPSGYNENTVSIGDGSVGPFSQAGAGNSR